MTPTAEEILNKHSKIISGYDDFRLGYMFGYAADIEQISFAAMKEISSIAFDAGAAHEDDQPFGAKKTPSKEEFMKKLFKE